jgi:hypothetical protein
MVEIFERVKNNEGNIGKDAIQSHGYITYQK